MTDDLGLEKKSIHELDVPDGERAHYSKKTIDFEYDFPFGKDELYGLAYRTDFDLKNHFKEAPYEDLESKEKFYPHVIEPSFGVDRSVLAVLSNAYTEEEGRVVLKLKPSLAPFKVAVFPLLKNKPELVEKAREVYSMLKKEFNVIFDDRGNIGKRYYSQDEIGTPFCVTVDFDSLENEDVTVRDRDSTKQERIKIKDLVALVKEKLS
jgi:glycyl-tRNA synthetase